MASQVDPTIILDNAKVSKADMRTQLEIIAAEITALQNATSVAREMGFDDADFDTL